MHTLYLDSIITCQEDPDEIEPYLIFINIDSIGRININGTGYQRLVTGLHNGVAIDYQ